MRTKYILLAACATLAFTACKKDKKTSTPDPEPVLNCDLASERTNLFDGKLVYEYDVQNRLVKITKSGVVQSTIEYQDNGRTVVEAKEQSIFTYTLNDDGKMAKVVESTNTGATYTTYYTYVDGLVTRTVSENIYSQGGTPVRDTTIYVNHTANGNLIKEELKDTDGNLLATLISTHQLNRPNNIPKPRPYAGDDLFTSSYDKNLLSTRSFSTQSSNATITYDYEFDTKGRVSKMFLMAQEGSATNYDTVLYKYRCD